MSVSSFGSTTAAAATTSAAVTPANRRAMPHAGMTNSRTRPVPTDSPARINRPRLNPKSGISRSPPANAPARLPKVLAENTMPAALSADRPVRARKTSTSSGATKPPTVAGTSVTAPAAARRTNPSPNQWAPPT